MKPSVAVKIHALMIEGKTRQEIVAVTGLSYNTVCAAIRDIAAVTGIRVRHDSFSPKQSRDAEIVQRLKDGASLSALAAEHGITSERIRQIGESAGVKAIYKKNKMAKGALKQRAIAERARIRDEKIAEAIRLIESGMSKAKAARAVGLHKNTIWYHTQGVESRHGRWQTNLPERRAKALEILRSGGQLVDAVRASGLSFPAIRNVLNKHGQSCSRPRQPKPEFIISGDWSADELKRLKALAAKGKSASDISREINRSRNAVIGKCHREKILLGPHEP